MRGKRIERAKEEASGEASRGGKHQMTILCARSAQMYI